MENRIPAQKKLHADWMFQHITQWLGLGLVLLILAIIVTLVWASWPSIHAFGWHFLWSAQWDPAHNEFGGLVAIIGT